MLIIFLIEHQQQLYQHEEQLNNLDLLLICVQEYQSIYRTEKFVLYNCLFYSGIKDSSNTT